MHSYRLRSYFDGLFPNPYPLTIAEREKVRKESRRVEAKRKIVVKK
jgi:hypothetical protein